MRSREDKIPPLLLGILSLGCYNSNLSAQLLPLYPALVTGDVLGVQQLVGWGILAQAVLGGGA